jgi:hypothetical protein
VTPAKEKTMSCAQCQLTKEEQLAIRDEMLQEIASIASPERVVTEDSVVLIKEIIAVYDLLEKGELHNISAGPVADAAVLAIHKITTPMATAYSI